MIRLLRLFADCTFRLYVPAATFGVSVDILTAALESAQTGVSVDLNQFPMELRDLVYSVSWELKNPAKASRPLLALEAIYQEAYPIVLAREAKLRNRQPR